MSSLAQAGELHDDIAALLEREKLVGAVWSTVDAYGAIEGAAGLKDTRTGQALTADDRVHIGSVTKTLVATGVLRLVSEGRLALDTPVSELVPEIAFDNPWADTDPVLVRHLLDHTAGLDDASLHQVFSLEPSADTPLAEAFAGTGRVLRVRSRPGSRLSYSNSGYTLAGMVIESVTGERYETWLDRELLRPLEMHDSTFAFVSQEGPRADPRLAMGHFENGKPQATVPIYVRPAVQFTTTARDMTAFARFLMGDGSIAGKPFITESLLRAMGRAEGTEAARAGLQVGYALGLYTRDRHGVTGQCHGGSTVGYRAMFCIFPKAQRAFFMAINADSEAADYNAFDQRMVQALGLETPAAAPVEPAAAAIDTTAWAGWYVPAPNRFARFEWIDTVLGFVRVRAQGAGLELKPFMAPALPLAPVGKGLYRAPDRTIASHVLLTSAEGKRVLSTGIQSFEQVSLMRLVPLWLSLLLGLAGLAWVLVGGSLRLLARRISTSHALFVPLLAAFALLVPLPFFLTQSFLQLGDLTPASGLLALVTLALPLAMLAGLWRHVRRRPAGAVAILDAVAMLSVLQFSLVLAAWGLMPLRLWT